MKKKKKSKKPSLPIQEKKEEELIKLDKYPVKRKKTRAPIPMKKQKKSLYQFF